MSAPSTVEADVRHSCRMGGRAVLAPSLRVERIGPFTTLSPKLGLTATLPWALELRANAGQAHNQSWTS